MYILVKPIIFVSEVRNLIESNTSFNLRKFEYEDNVKEYLGGASCLIYTSSELVKLTNLGKTTINGYRNSVKNKSPFHSSGRQPTFTREYMEDEIMKTLDSREDKLDCMTTKDLQELLKTKAAEFRRIRGLPSKDNDICMRTIKRYTKKYGIATVKGQKKSRSRIISELDMSNAISTAALMGCFMPFINPCCAIQTDATTIISRDGDLNKLVIRRNRTRNRAATSASEPGLELGIKFFPMCNYAGNFAEPILILADAKIPANDFRYIYIPHLNPSTVNGRGLLFFY